MYINAECFIIFEFIMHVGIQNVKIMNTRIHAWFLFVSICSFRLVMVFSAKLKIAKKSEQHKFGC